MRVHYTSFVTANCEHAWRAWLAFEVRRLRHIVVRYGAYGRACRLSRLVFSLWMESAL